MKGLALASAVAAFNLVSADPTRSLRQPPSKRADLPVVSASGNGSSKLLFLPNPSRRRLTEL